MVVLRTFLLLIIGIALSLGFCNTTIAKEKKASNKEKTASTAIISFDLNTERLPANYKGTDIVRLYSMLAKKVPLKKDEFETTDEYGKKIAKAVTDDIFAFKLEPKVFVFNSLRIYPYDADTQILTIDLESEFLSEYTFEDYRASFLLKSLDKSYKSYIGSNAFGATRLVKEFRGTQYGIAFVNQQDFGKSDFDDARIENIFTSVRKISINIEMPRNKAKSIKNNIGVLLICKPALYQSRLIFEKGYYDKATIDNPNAFSYDRKYINVEIFAIWVYDLRTGEILLKKQLKDVKQVSYADNGNGTITDNGNGLMWQKEDDNTRRTLAAAGTYCNSLTIGGQSDWRLPSKEELITIVDHSISYRIPYPGPAINATYFPNTHAAGYWSSTTYDGNTDYAWVVPFSNGYVGSYDKSSDYYVRCVRGGQ